MLGTGPSPEYKPLVHAVLTQASNLLVSDVTGAGSPSFTILFHEMAERVRCEALPKLEASAVADTATEAARHVVAAAGFPAPANATRLRMRLEAMDWWSPAPGTVWSWPPHDGSHLLSPPTASPPGSSSCPAAEPQGRVRARVAAPLLRRLRACRVQGQAVARGGPKVSSLGARTPPRHLVLGSETRV